MPRTATPRPASRRPASLRPPHPRGEARAHRLDPLRALAHPLWWSALGLLALNDHLLKGAGILPAAVTGKLSDVVGLVAAPAVLAVAVAALRTLRPRPQASPRRPSIVGPTVTRATWWGLHALIGAVFAAINLSPQAARGFEGLMALGPLPWHIVVDPTDLLALPALALSAVVLGRAMASRRAPSGRARRAALASAWALGALACMATSPPPCDDCVGPPPIGQFFPDHWAALVYGHDTEDSQVLRVRELRDEVRVDCETLANDPTGALSRRLFGPPTLWQVDPGRTVPVQPSQGEPAQDRECVALLVDGSHLAMHLVVYSTSELQAMSVPSTIDDAALFAPDRLLRPDEDGFSLLAHDAVFAAPPLTDPDPSPACEVAPDTASLAWSEGAPGGTVLLTDVYASPDGCQSITYRRDSGEGLVVGWFLCLPPGLFPFAAGDLVFARDVSLGHGFGSVEGLELVSGGRTLRLARGYDVVHLGDITASWEADSECGAYHDACGNRVEPLTVSLSGVGFDVDLTPANPGAAATDGQGVTRSVHVVRAASMSALDAACGAGLGDGLGPWIESVFVRIDPSLEPPAAMSDPTPEADTDTPDEE